MINEGKGISDVIKEDVDKIYKLFCIHNGESLFYFTFGGGILVPSPSSVAYSPSRASICKKQNACGTLYGPGTWD